MASTYTKADGKLTEGYKQKRKKLKQRFLDSGGAFIRSKSRRVTCLLIPDFMYDGNSNSGRGFLITWSICAPGDTPRRKVGELVALEKWANCYTSLIIVADGLDKATALARDIANMLDTSATF